MAIISIFGKVDKRILAFPLIRALSMTGQTIAITDDGNFRNLYHDNGSSGMIDGVKIMVVHELNSEISMIAKEFQNIVYILTDRIELQADCTLVCFCDDKSLKSKVVGRFSVKKKDDSAIHIYLRMNPLKVKTNQIILKPEYYRYLVETEEKKELLILKDKKICRLLARICSEAVEMKETQFYQLLLRKRYETSSK